MSFIVDDNTWVYDNSLCLSGETRESHVADDNARANTEPHACDKSLCLSRESRDVERYITDDNTWENTHNCVDSLYVSNENKKGTRQPYVLEPYTNRDLVQMLYCSGNELELDFPVDWEQLLLDLSKYGGWKNLLLEKPNKEYLRVFMAYEQDWRVYDNLLLKVSQENEMWEIVGLLLYSRRVTERQG